MEWRTFPPSLSQEDVETLQADGSVLFDPGSNTQPPLQQLLVARACAGVFCRRCRVFLLGRSGGGAASAASHKDQLAPSLHTPSSCMTAGLHTHSHAHSVTAVSQCETVGGELHAYKHGRTNTIISSLKV